MPSSRDLEQDELGRQGWFVAAAGATRRAVTEGLAPLATEEETTRMTVRRLSLTGLLSLCATIAAMLFASVPALAAEEHPYLESHSQIGIHPAAGGSACGLVTDKFGDVYVSYYKLKEVEVYSPTGGKITTFKVPFTTQGPCSLAVDSEGDVYVEEYGGEVVKEKPTAFPPTATTTYALDETAGSKGVIMAKTGKADAIAVDPANQDLYVAQASSTSPQIASHISTYEPSGKLISATLGENLVPGANYYGIDVFGANGDIYVTDTAHARIYVLNPAGTEIIDEINGAGRPEGTFVKGMQMWNLAVDQASGDFYAYLAKESRIAAPAVVDEFNASGGYISQIGNEFGPSLHLEDFEPADVAVDNGASSPNDGDIYVAARAESGDADSVFAFGPLVASSEDPLSVNTTAGSGKGSVTSEPPGIDCGLVCEAKFPAGEKVKLTEAAETGSTFAGWSGGGCSGTASTCEVTMSSAQTVTATFNVAVVAKDKLTITKAGSGLGKVECKVGSGGSFGACVSEYAEGTELTLKGVEEAGSTFAGFSAGTGSASSCSGTANCTFTLSAESSLTATFNVAVVAKEPKAYDKLTFVSAGTGAGKVECEVESKGRFEPCAREYTDGTKVTLKGVAEGGSSFAGFSAGSGSAAACTGTANCSFTLSADSTLTATFNALGASTGTATEPGAEGRLPSIAVIGYTLEAPPPARTAAGNGSLLGHGSATASGANARVTLACSSAGACSAEVTLTTKVKHGHKTSNVVLGKAVVAIPAGQSRTIEVKLSKAAVELLRRRGSIAAKLVAPGASFTIELRRAAPHK